MKRYANLGGDSNIDNYSFAPDSITVYFMDGMAYIYTNRSAGSGNVAHMKDLAAAGQGLNSFIMNYVRFVYERKWRAVRG